MIRLRSCAATAQQVRRSRAASTVALRATANKSARQARLRTAVAIAAAVTIGGGPTLLACPVCFGAEETSMIDGAKLGVLVLLAITLAVQGAFVAFFLYLRRRAKRMAELELDTEWSELQGFPRTS